MDSIAEQAAVRRRNRTGWARTACLLGALAVALLLQGPARAWATHSERLEHVKAPFQALDFSAGSLAGRTVRLSDFRGQVVFLNFWATWCVPCRLEMPAMERLHQSFKQRPFKILAVNLLEPAQTVRAYAQELGLTLEILLDSAGEVSRAYNVNALPVTYIIDARGAVVARAIGARPWDEGEYLQYLAGLTQSAEGAGSRARGIGGEANGSR